MRKDFHMSKSIAVSGCRRIGFYVLQFTWGLPVNLIGFLIFLCCRGRFHQERFCNSIVTCLPGDRGGLSLGVFIFISTPGGCANRALCSHEYGHTIQCLLLGPLYWILIAIPSAIWYHFFANYRKKRHVAYDTLYCERWATSWGARWSGA